MLLGYNTNGFAHHRLPDAMAILSELGYKAIAITLDHGVLNPFSPDSAEEAATIRKLAHSLGLTIVIETGARYLLNPRLKHEPTLVSPHKADRQRRIDFLYRAIDTAVALDAKVVSLWSGIVHDGASREEAFDRLTEGLAKALDDATHKGVSLAFEPEPEMLVDTMAAYDELKQRLVTKSARADLKLTIDIGHLHCQGEVPIADVIGRYADDLINIHIEDMRARVHEHLPFGEGEIDFPPILHKLQQINYSGPIGVELSRDSHRAPEMAQRAFEYLAPLVSLKK